MKFILLMLFSVSTRFLDAAVIDIDANLSDTEKGFSLNVRLKNTGKDGVYLPTFGGKLLDLRLDLWCLGKGIELYQIDDAEWRRKQAFFAYEWHLLKPGEKMNVSVNLSQMKASNPDNDELSKKIISDFSFLKEGRANVSVIVSQANPELEKGSIRPQIYQSVTVVR
jgi:hypothetical protein